MRRHGERGGQGDCIVNKSGRAARALLYDGQVGPLGFVIAAVGRGSRLGFACYLGDGDGSGLFTIGRVVGLRSEEHTSELQSLMRTSYAVFCLNKKKKIHNTS